MALRMMLQHHTEEESLRPQIAVDPGAVSIARSLVFASAPSRETLRKILRAHSKKLYCNVKETRLLVPVIAS
jgi:hypothetical protein